MDSKWIEIVVDENHPIEIKQLDVNNADWKWIESMLLNRVNIETTVSLDHHLIGSVCLCF